MAQRPRRRRSRRPIPRKQAARPKPKAVPKAKAVPPAAVPPVAKGPSPSDTGTAVKMPPPKVVPAADPYVGRTIGRCRIEERIGRGKTAFVYRAHYEALDEKVAIKILTPHAAAMPELVERFISEARTIAQLDNENVVKIYDVGSEGDDHFMVMELLDGFSVLDLIQREDQIAPLDALRVIRQAANGLAAAHSKGIIHRDVKPQNLLLLEDGTVKVLDFGLAAGFDDKSERVGTPHYMAPETCRDGTAELGTDVYALGIVLWHLLTGQPPYAGLDIKGILRKHIEGEPLKVERERRDVPKDVAELVRTMTKSDPLLRPPAQELVELLDQIGGEEVKEHAGLRTRSTRHRRARAEARSKSPLGPALAGLVIVIGLIIVVAMGTGDSKGDTPEEPDPTPVANKPPVDPSGIEKRNETDLTGVKPMETDAQREERLQREQEEAERQAKEKAEREAIRNSKKDLDAATQWARENWHGKTDTEAVRTRYLRVWRKYKKTPSGKEARRLATGIKEGTIHPHPDRSWSDAQSIAEAREEWRLAQPEIERFLAKHQYAGAYGKLPERVNEADGQLTGDLRFWDKLLSQLKTFQSALVKEVATLAKDDRTIETPDGEGQVRIVTPTSFEVSLNGALKKFAWSELDPAQILDVARRSFSGKGTRFDTYALSFAFAHKLENEFWDVQLDVMSAPDKVAHEQWVTELETRFAERLK
ncbi:MAG: serine/threonine-protein kinase [Planctomycetota bacterium]|nr:serine/threonine-protein kinase [Planctomycetota bacterium]